ncbi:hypothetical protein G0U57_015149 [Chelydra serpentina]|uniref:Uncharacterized protein n=2 Tax=Chelydra serpentina TaxID=8475 RepID=A0A8C3T413_CHESE|nr:hypothetical protein G0U57_015149 [Chelydra serpentina]
MKLAQRFLVRGNICYMATSSAKSSTEDHYRQRATYAYFLPIQTRWQDNDQYGHVNNAVYYSYFDTIINHFLIRYCGLDTNTLTSSMVGFMVTTRCSFHGPIKFPQNPLGALGVEKIGRSSVHYRLALFLPKPHQKPAGLHHNTLIDGCFLDSPVLEMFERVACATGLSTHVFVTPTTKTPISLPDDFKRCLQKLQ